MRPAPSRICCTTGTAWSSECATRSSSSCSRRTSDSAPTGASAWDSRRRPPPAAGGDERILWYDAIGLLVVVGGNTIIRIGVFDPKTLVRAILADERPARDVFLTIRQPKYSRPLDAKSGAPPRTALVTITLKNSGRGMKMLNPNFLVLVDRSGRVYRYDPSTFRQADACRSTVAVQPGEAASCSLVFVIRAGESARSIVFNDGASTDEAFF